MKIAFLGLGVMGTPMARHLLAAGHEVTVWNRSPEPARALASEGARVVSSAIEAVKDAPVVMTSLFDDTAYEAVLFGAGGVLQTMQPGALHVSLSTISVALSDRLTAEHAQRGHRYVGAPVFGRPDIAEVGKLWIVVAGEEQAIALARHLLEVFSRGISVVGAEPRQAHALKLGGNFLISAMLLSLSEAFVYAESQGIPPDVFLEAVNNALFQSSFYAAYGKVMLNPPKDAGASMGLGEKDNRLLREAAASGHVRLSLADELAQIFTQARESGLGDEDWAVGQYRMAQHRGRSAG
jgi:3-hydroxyisobutyrate dehydrogenase-like beta-hydroxyacid dehydrogenase